MEVASEGASFTYVLNRKKLRNARRREGRYLLRTNLSGKEPAELWRLYIQLTEIEAAFKNLKDDLRLRPIHHHLAHRIEAAHRIRHASTLATVLLRANWMEAITCAPQLQRSADEFLALSTERGLPLFSAWACIGYAAIF